MKTDEQIQQDVIAELGWDRSVDAATIGVEVKDGIVTLAGHVDSHIQKWHAERAAQRVSGVRAVAVEMDVILPGASQRNDADIARAAENVIEWSTSLPRDSIKVMVEGGWITLAGVVDWEYQRQAASASVRDLMGVTGISDQIAIRPRTSREVVKSDIEAALARRAHADAQRILVGVSGSTVTLGGTVHSWAERDVAVHSAWGTAGVSSVQNDIKVAD